MVLPRAMTRLAVVLALLPAPALAAQGGGSSVVSGRVLDATSREPLQYVLIDISIPGEDDRRVETNAEGRFRVEELPPQLIRLRLRLIGYRTLDRALNLYAGRVSAVTYELQPAEVVLPEVEVTEAAPTTVLMMGFEERRKQGFGTFYTLDDLERQENRNVVDLIREAPGVRIIRSTTNGMHAISNRRVVGGPARTQTRECFLQVVIDGLMFWSPDAGGEVTLRSGPPPDLSRLLSTKELAGVEVYAGMTGVPVEYRRDGVQCGTVVFWTKRGSMRAPGS